MDERGVCFRTRRDKHVTLAPEEFLRRFLMHVLPKGFVKIRHYGLLASSHATTTLEIARERLATAGARSSPPASVPSNPERRAKDWREHLARLTGIDLARCPRCGHGPRLRVALDLFEPSSACMPPDTS